MPKAAVRYGAEIRKLAKAVRKQKAARYECPECGKKSVKRVGNALWKCKSCGSVFAGGAYALSTAAGEVSRRLISEKKG